MESSDAIGMIIFVFMIVCAVGMVGWIVTDLFRCLPIEQPPIPEPIKFTEKPAVSEPTVPLYPHIEEFTNAIARAVSSGYEISDVFMNPEYWRLIVHEHHARLSEAMRERYRESRFSYASEESYAINFSGWYGKYPTMAPVIDTFDICIDRSGGCVL